MAPASNATRPAGRPESPTASTFALVSHTAPSSPNPSTGSSSNGNRSGVAFDPPLRPFDRWLHEYAAGRVGLSDQAPEPPAAISAILEGAAVPSLELGGGSAEESLHLVTPASSILEHYRQNGYMPAPKIPHEEERLKLAKLYGLEAPRRRAAIDTICRVAKRHFKTATVVISLTFSHHQVLAAEIGWGLEEPGPDEPPRPLSLEPAFCTHALTRKDPNELFVVGDANTDWRFKGNPYATANGGGASFYAAANIRLPTEGLSNSEELPASLPVGAVCLVDDKPRDPATFTSDDREVLQDLASLVARELTLGLEQSRAHENVAQTDFVNSFLNASLVSDTVPLASPSSTSPTSAPPTPPSPAIHIPASPNASRPHAAPATNAILSDSNSDAAPSSTPDSTFVVAAAKLRALTGASSAAVLDLRAFRETSAPQMSEQVPSRGSPKPVSPFNHHNGMEDLGKAYVMACSGNVLWSDHEGDELVGAVAQGLRTFHATSVVEFEHPGYPTSAFSTILPEATSASLCLPIFNFDGAPALFIVLASSEKHFLFDATDTRFAKNVGAILAGYLLRQRALEADRAKLAFVSQISHDVRTPLHGICSQVELIRECSSPSQLVTLAPLLDTAEVCLESLRDVLDDTLNYAKLTTTRVKTNKKLLAVADLDQIVEDVAKATWVRKRRVDIVSADVAGSKTGPESINVDLILDIEARHEGWAAKVDKGGLKRVLLNLIGNSLKFTPAGHVKVTLSTVFTESGREAVKIDVSDTGVGMSESFIRDGRIFTPFVQENSFVTGAGLGMSICDTIIKRMGGSIDIASTQGRGTTISISLPLQFEVSPVTPATERTRSVRNISNELELLFKPGPASLVNSPASEPPNVDFSVAVEAAQASKTLNRVPSKRKKSSLLSEVEPDSLVVEAAKLSIMTPPTPPAGPVVNPFDNAKAGARSLLPKPKFTTSPSFAPDLKVLIAEDNPIARNILTKLLTTKGIAFEQAVDGVEALELYKAGAGSFNLFLADVQMPRMDGVEASVHIRAFEKEQGLPRCRVVALTGLSKQEGSAAETADCFDGWLLKGTPKTLRLILDEIKIIQESIEDRRSSVQA